MSKIAPPVEPVAAKLKPEKRVAVFEPVWSDRISALEKFFAATILPSIIQLNSHSLITDPALFVETHLSVVNFNNGNPRFLVYLGRLEQMAGALNAVITAGRGEK